MYITTTQLIVPNSMKGNSTMNYPKVNVSRSERSQSITIQAVIQTPQDMDAIKQAAECSGMSVSSFTRFHVLAAARKVVSEHVAAS